MTTGEALQRLVASARTEGEDLILVTQTGYEVRICAVGAPIVRVLRGPRTPTNPAVERNAIGAQREGKAEVDGPQGPYEVLTFRCRRPVTCGRCEGEIPAGTLFTKIRPGMTGKQVLPACSECRPFRVLQGTW